ncbi:hypothetical protein [Pseudoxanthomonas indica]|uniref:Phospholipase_D-nuclease N-terminal n=1 Tax=Pseudoxanthomonas indica TaxID=428993 RepID=A0A1T5LTX0_9GAMM|nr:hypothetical protein [Pseudoxanthomonas indica]GGD39456.1 hypothetical protein GCM10007235_09400 [Pseudoxanthomonas indica]SKC79432.1 hypothetical protein SAMN06296058_3067 [Pseudoxanthomonas indica]
MNIWVILWLAVGYVASFFFLPGLLRGSERGWEKWGLAVMLFVPFLGLLIYLFLREDVPPQDPNMRAPGSRGVYTDRMIAMRSFYEDAFKELEEKVASKAVAEETTVDDDEHAAEGDDSSPKR